MANTNPANFDDVKVTEAPEVPDFRLQREGSISILYVETDAAQQWVADHIPSDATWWGRNGLVIEWRYVDDILFGIENDGLSVQR